ncbi:hypothetical protein C8Q79DRAFT_1012193 [Trametes meyenii]|nr:hypothetical protein C8Q79DRAFT_1012193 [Trametes meyenii]
MAGTSDSDWSPIPAMYPFLYQEELTDDAKGHAAHDKIVNDLEKLEPDVLQDVEKLMQFTGEMASIHNQEQRDEMARKIFQRTRPIVDFVSKMAQVHPVVQAVAKAVSGALQLEIQRLENNSQIAAVHTEMTNTVFHLRYLIRVPETEESKLESALNVLCQGIADAVLKFGEFAHTYHLHWHKIYKTVFSLHHKNTLEDFTKQFKKLKEDMNNIFQSMTNVQLYNIAGNTSEILRRLQSLDPREQAAERFMHAKGGPDKVMQSPELLDRMGKILGERVTYSMKNAFKEGYDAHLDKHRKHYNLKLTTVTNIFLGDHDRSRDVTGSSIFIENEAFRHIWSTHVRNCICQMVPFMVIYPVVVQGWNSTVKCRRFVEALHECFYKQLQGDPNEDTKTPRVKDNDRWTLNYLSRAMYYSTIGDIIDDDGSNYISALELNVFLQSRHLCLPAWTKPQCFAFWAAGWCNNNVWYHNQLNRMMQDLTHSMNGLNIKPRETGKVIRSIITSLVPLILVADCQNIFGDDDHPQPLLNLQEEFRTHEEEAIDKNLTSFNAHLEDEHSVMSVIGDARIELHIMPLLYLLAKRLCDLLDRLLRQRSIDGGDLIKVEELAGSFSIVFSTFDHRLNSLCRGWRFEAKDVGIQVNRYADGLFKKYYSAVRMASYDGY